MPKSTDLLVGCRAKIERSKECIFNLNKEITEYLSREPKPYRITNRHQDNGLEYAFVAFGNPEVPSRFAVLVGEIFHQFRSSLDHLLCALVIKNGGTPTKQNQFPICTSAKKFEEARSRGLINGVSSRAENLIASVQPYTSTNGPPEDTLLCGIQEQNNLDKHQLLPIVCTLGAIDREIRIGYDADVLKAINDPKAANIVGFGDWSPRKISEDGVVIWTIRLAEPCPQFRADTKIVCDIAFEKIGRGELIPVIRLLNGMLQATVHTVDVFKDEF